MRAEGDEGQERRGGGERERVDGADAEDERAKEARDGDRGGEAGGDAEADEQEAARQDQAHDVAALRAERDADADLARALTDAVRHDAVQPDRREKDGDGGKPGSSRVTNSRCGGRLPTSDDSVATP